jgi:hypothetical protein
MGKPGCLSWLTAEQFFWTKLPKSAEFCRPKLMRVLQERKICASDRKGTSLIKGDCGDNQDILGMIKQKSFVKTVLSLAVFVFNVRFTGTKRRYSYFCRQISGRSAEKMRKIYCSGADA